MQNLFQECCENEKFCCINCHQKFTFTNIMKSFNYKQKLMNVISRNINLFIKSSCTAEFYVKIIRDWVKKCNCHYFSASQGNPSLFFILKMNLHFFFAKFVYLKHSTESIIVFSWFFNGQIYLKKIVLFRIKNICQRININCKWTILFRTFCSLMDVFTKIIELTLVL